MALSARRSMLSSIRVCHEPVKVVFLLCNGLAATCKWTFRCSHSHPHSLEYARKSSKAIAKGLSLELQLVHSLVCHHDSKQRTLFPTSSQSAHLVRADEHQKPSSKPTWKDRSSNHSYRIPGCLNFHDETLRSQARPSFPLRMRTW